MIYIIGDTHGDFRRIFDFCMRFETSVDGIEDRLEYKKWYCGHYHTEKKIDKLEIMFESFGEFSDHI